MQILLAEIRASFELTALSLGADASTAMDSPPQAARAIVQTFLTAIPEQHSIDAQGWTAAVAQAEASVQAALDRGIAAISAWRNVPPLVVDAAKETRQLIATALDDDVQNPAWLRPEWGGLAPRLQEFRRRRRLSRRRLIDPDHQKGSVDDSDVK